MEILIVLTSNESLGNSELKTGVWLEDLAVAYYTFKSAGFSVTLTSPAGGQPPIDPRSKAAAFQSEDTRRFLKDQEAQKAFVNTAPLQQMTSEKFDAIYYPGGHGLFWDLVDHPGSIHLIESAFAANRFIAFLSHATGVLMHAKNTQGRPLTEGKDLTGFTNAEETSLQLHKVVPFLIEEMIAANGGSFSKLRKWHPYCVRDGFLITGQNSNSAKLLATTLIEALDTKQSNFLEDDDVVNEENI